MWRLKEKTRSDNGAAVTILALALLVLFLFISVFMVDFVKNTQIKNDYQQIGQRAAEAAEIKQTGIGGLSPYESANTFVSEYMLGSRGYDPASGTENYNQTTDTAAFRKNSCSQGNQYPKITLTYNTGRTTAATNTKDLPTATSVGGETPTFVGNVSIEQFTNAKYKVISAKITDASDNYFYGMFGHPCQIYTFNVSSVAVNANNN